MELKTNVNKLVKMAVVGEVCSPLKGRTPYAISADGVPMVLPGVGGITYNVRVGDLATGWVGDHVEPGVSIMNKEKEDTYGGSANTALNTLACIGNEAVVISGDAKGSKGVVVGKHGGVEHVLVDFQEEILEKLVIGDKVMVRAFGLGLKLLFSEEVKIMNMDPLLLNKMNLELKNDRLIVPVTHLIPSAIMGSGIGASQTYTGDYDIQLFDETMKSKYGLEDLRLGDIVAIEDADHSYGRIYKKGVISIGVIVHTDCIIAGHGPGVTTLMTSQKIVPRIDSKANIANILGIRSGI